MLKKQLAKAEVPHKVIDIREDDSAYQFLKDNGIGGTPAWSEPGKDVTRDIDAVRAYIKAYTA